MCIFATQGCVFVFAKVLLVDTHSRRHKQNKLIESFLGKPGERSKVKHVVLSQDKSQSRTEISATRIYRNYL